MGYADQFKVFGPYEKQKDKRSIVIVIDKDGNRRTVSYPKWIMECHLKRQLDPDLESVDHINRNHHDNRISNLRLVPRDQHSADDTKRVKLITFECNECGKSFERSPRLVRDKSKKGVTGIFCSRQCAGKYSRKVQLKLIKKLPVQPYIESEYYRRKKASVEENDSEPDCLIIAAYFQEKYLLKF